MVYMEKINIDKLATAERVNTIEYVYESVIF